MKPYRGFNIFMKRISLLITMFWLVGCATTSEYAMQGAPVPEGSYAGVLEKWTAEKKAYSGIVSTFQVIATLQTTDIIQHQVFIESSKTQRTTDQYLTARRKALEETANQTQMFIALYTEKDENNDIDLAKTKWNLFLDVNGRRISPSKVKKVYENRTALLDRYPYLNTWSKFYLLDFPIPQSQVTAQTVTFTMAGPLGSAQLKFPQ